MAKCPNCGNSIGCSCSGGSALRVASDGTQVCTKCINNYEKNLQIKQSSNKTQVNEA